MDLLATIFVSGNESENRRHLKASSGLCICEHSLHTKRHTKISGRVKDVGDYRIWEWLCLGGDLKEGDLGGRIDKTTQASREGEAWGGAWFWLSWGLRKGRP